MPLYNYRSKSNTGEILEGTEFADSKEEVIQILSEKEYYPITIKKAKEKGSLEINLFSRIKTKNIAIFCRQVHTMLAAGVTIVEILDILSQEEENVKFKEIIQSLYEDVQKGNAFSSVLKQYPKVFPSLLVYMVFAGETSGRLDVVMSRLAIHYEKEGKINNKIKNSMIYPMVLSIIAILVVLFMMVVVMPTFMSMYQDSGVALPKSTLILLAVSNSLQARWFVYIGVIVALTYLFHMTSRTKSGRRVIDSWKLRFPLFRRLSKKIIASRFSRTMSTMLGNGVPLIQSLENVASAVGNSVVEEHLLSIKEEISEGTELSVLIRKTKMFPPLLNGMIKVGEESGTLDIILDKTADYYDEEVEAETQRVLTFLEPVLIVVMGLIIGFIVVSMVIPLFDVYELI